MANEKKMTKVEMFKSLLDNYDLTDKEIEFINHEIELLEKKNGNRKPTAQQLKNKAVAESVLEYLRTTGKKMQIKQMIKEIPCLAEMENCTPQYAMAIVRPMKESGIIGRVEEKGTALFYAVGE
jgi:predicted RNase H-like nuclease (RuvC/YqgF family)